MVMVAKSFRKEICQKKKKTKRYLIQILQLTMTAVSSDEYAFVVGVQISLRIPAIKKMF